MIREFFRCTYRATEGFGHSLIALLQIDLAIPDFTSLQKRAAKLGIDIDVTKYAGKIDLVVDGKTYRFKMTAEKEFLTKFGHVTMYARGVYRSTFA